MPAVFISYRREDCPAHAGRLYDALSTRFGEQNVFMDVDAIDLGVDFVAKIEQAIGGCDVVLALIGDEWLTVKDRDGNRRLDLAGDFVRQELTHALAREDVRVIPVLVEGAHMPDTAELPEAISGLTRRNGVSLSENHWRTDTSVLIDAIDRVVAADPSSRPAAGRSAAEGGRHLREDQASKSTRGWTIAALLWLAPLWFIATGSRTGDRRLSRVGFVYLAGYLASVLLSSISSASMMLFGIVWVGSAINYFTIRGNYAAASAGDP